MHNRLGQIALILAVLTAVASLPSRLAASPNQRALVIGVSEYFHINSLDNADSDARLFQRMLTNPEVASLPPDAVRLLQSSLPTGHPDLSTRANILRELETLAATPQDGGTLWFYFSGHGMEFNRFSHIAPMDADPARPLTEQLLPMSDVRRLLKQACPNGNIIVVLDACQSGSPRSVKFRDLVQEVAEAAAPGANVITVAAADVNQAAMEVSAPPGGVFTYFFVRALCGDADANQDGMVLASEAKSYVCTRVAGFVKRHTGGDQMPQFLLHEGGDVPLTHSSTPAIDSLPVLRDDVALTPATPLVPGIVLAIDGDQDNLALRVLAAAVPAEEYRLVDPGAAATMSALAQVLGPSRDRTSHLAVGARYLALVKITTPTQHYPQTRSYKCTAGVLVQVFDESGSQIGIAEREVSRAAFDEREAVRMALRAACTAIAGTPEQSPFLDALHGAPTP